MFDRRPSTLRLTCRVPRKPGSKGSLDLEFVFVCTYECELRESMSFKCSAPPESDFPGYGGVTKALVGVSRNSLYCKY